MNQLIIIRDPIFAKSFNINFATSFFVYLCMYLLIVVIASYSKSEYHASDSVAGLVVGPFIVGSLIGRFVTGKYVNRSGPKKILIFGLMCLVVTQLFYFISGSVWFLMMVRLMNGLITAVTTTATRAITAYITPPTRKNEGISLFSLGLVLGTATGPFFGMLLMNSFSISILFTICVVLGIISGLLSLLIKINFITVKENTITHKRSNLAHFVTKETIPVAFVMLLIGVTYAAILTYLWAFAAERDLVASVSCFFIFYAIASLITRPITGRSMDDEDENVVVHSAFIFLVLPFVLLMLSFNGWVLLIAGIVLGIGYGNLSSCIQAIAIKVSPSNKYGLATPTYFAGLDIGVGFGPSLLGLFTYMISYNQLYEIIDILGFITLVIYILVHGRKVCNASY